MIKRVLSILFIILGCAMLHAQELKYYEHLITKEKDSGSGGGISKLSNGDYLVYSNIGIEFGNIYRQASSVYYMDEFLVKQNERVDSLYRVQGSIHKDGNDYFLLKQSQYHPDGYGAFGIYTLNEDLSFKLVKKLELDSVNEHFWFYNSFVKHQGLYYGLFTGTEDFAQYDSYLVALDDNFNVVKEFIPEGIEGAIPDFCFSEDKAFVCDYGMRVYDSEWNFLREFDIPEKTSATNPGDTGNTYENFYDAVNFSNGTVSGVTSVFQTVFVSDTPFVTTTDQQLFISNFNEEGNFINEKIFGSDTIYENYALPSYYSALQSTNNLNDQLFVGTAKNSISSKDQILAMTIHDYGESFHPQSVFGNPDYSYSIDELLVDTATHEAIIYGDVNKCGTCEAEWFILRLDVRVYQAIEKLNRPDFEFTIHPNPAQEHVKISGLKKERNYHYALYNASGKTIKQGPLLNPEMDVSQLRSGTYLLNLQSANGLSATKQLMVK